jgi:hypothetical protein
LAEGLRSAVAADGKVDSDGGARVRTVAYHDVRDDVRAKPCDG